MIKCTSKDCDYFKTYGECSSACENQGFTKKITNYDRIQNMSVGEMASDIYKYAHNMCRFCVYSKGWKCTSALKTCVNGIKQWLESEAEDDE